MSLRELAAADNRAILESTSDFGWPIRITDPDGETADLVGFSNDISQTIDPQTGQAVTGREATAVLSLASLADEGFGVPQGIDDGALKPWTVMFSDINGNEHTFKVMESLVDRSIGCVTCRLEAYKSVAP